jgi:hypothetical protein
MNNFSTINIKNLLTKILAFQLQFATQERAFSHVQNQFVYQELQYESRTRTQNKETPRNTVYCPSAT